MPLAETGARDSGCEQISVQYALSEQLRTLASVPEQERLRGWCRHLLQRLHVTDGEVTLRIVTEAEMQQLNARYRGRDRVTNVLSFPFEGPDEQQAHSIEMPVRLLGDIVLCATVISREAAAQNKSSEAHWAHMVVHGVLHLLNYDHQESEAADEMERLETEMLRELGYPPPYEHE